MSKGVKITILAVCALLAVVIGLFVSTWSGSSRLDNRQFSELGGDFTLNSSQGEVSLSDFQGKVVVMYFGFLSCPEVCPNSLGVIQTALSRLSETELNQTQAILVSVDPKRDTLELLAEYADFYHPNIVGLTGDIKIIDNVTRQYGAYYNYTEIEKVNKDYGVEHSSRYYVINQNGKLIAAMRHSTTPNELYAQIQELLNKS